MPDNFNFAAGGINSPHIGSGGSDVIDENIFEDELGFFENSNLNIDSVFGGGQFFEPGAREGDGGFRQASQPGSIMGPIGNVGPNQGTFEMIWRGVMDAFKKFDWLGATKAAIKDRDRDSNGVPAPSNPTQPDIGAGVPTNDPAGEFGGENDQGTDGEFDGNVPDFINGEVETPNPGDEDMADNPFGISGGVAGGATRSESLSEQGAEATSASGGVSAGSSQDRIAFEDIFAKLFGGASSAAAGLDPSMLTETSNQLFSGGLNFLDQLSGGVDTEFLEATIRGDDGLLDKQISGLGEDIGKFFREELLTGITSESIVGGGLGGSRQGLAEGGAADASLREFQRGTTDLRVADQARRTNAAGLLGESRVAGATAGLGGLESLSGIADTAFGANLEPFERLAALLGDATVLGSSETGATNFASSLSSSFGRSQTSADSETDSKRIDLRFGA